MTKLFCTPLLLVFSIGCTSHDVKPSPTTTVSQQSEGLPPTAESTAEEAAKKIDRKTAGELSGKPSSFASSEAHPSGYDMLLQSKDPEHRILNDLHLITAVRVEAGKYLKEFDQQLDEKAIKRKSTSASASDRPLLHPSYANLLACRTIADRSRTRLLQVHLRLQEKDDQLHHNFSTEPDSTQQKSERSRSKDDRRKEMRQRAKLREIFYRLLAREKTGANKEAVDELFHGIDFGIFLNGTTEKGAKKIQIAASSNQDDENYSERATSLPQEEQLEERILKSEIASLAKEYSIALQAGFNKRSPQSVDGTSQNGEAILPRRIDSEIVPSPGPNGTVNGSSFRDGRWALSFDDGPIATNTSSIIENLHAHHLHGSFFWLAKLAPENRSIVEDAIQNKMSLGNHTFTHPNLMQASEAVLQYEIVQAQQVLDEKAGYTPTVFRCPYGACGTPGSRVRQIVAQLGLINVSWNIDSLDWQDKDPQSIFARVKKQMAIERHGIILFHETEKQTIIASRLLMELMEKKVAAGEWRDLTVEDAINELNSASSMK